MQRVLLVSSHTEFIVHVQKMAPRFRWHLSTAHTASEVPSNTRFDVILFAEQTLNVLLSPIFAKLDREFPSAVLLAIVLFPNSTMGTYPPRKLSDNRWLCQISYRRSTLIEEEVCALLSETIGSSRYTQAVPASNMEPETNKNSESHRSPRTRLLNPTLPKQPLLVIGSSTGGVQALQRFVSQLPKDFSVPTVIAHHIPAGFQDTLRDMLAKDSPIPVHIARDKQPIKPEIYIAPHDHHIVIQEELLAFRARLQLRLTQSEKEHFMRPAVDPLFRSAAELTQSNTVAIVLTGMGTDGLEGSKKLSETGATILVQDEESSTVWGMPKAVYSENLASEALPPETMAQRIMEFFQKKQ